MTVLGVIDNSVEVEVALFPSTGMAPGWTVEGEVAGMSFVLCVAECAKLALGSSATVPSGLCVRS